MPFFTNLYSLRQPEAVPPVRLWTLNGVWKRGKIFKIPACLLQTGYLCLWQATIVPPSPVLGLPTYGMRGNWLLILNGIWKLSIKKLSSKIITGKSVWAKRVISLAPAAPRGAKRDNFRQFSLALSRVLGIGTGACPALDAGYQDKST